jgi:hypothetical protein
VLFGVHDEAEYGSRLLLCVICEISRVGDG